MTECFRCIAGMAGGLVWWYLTDLSKQASKRVSDSLHDVFCPCWSAAMFA